MTMTMTSIIETVSVFDENNKPIGSDIEIGMEIARRMGVEAQFSN